MNIEGFGRVAIVTGGAQGIGLAIAQELYSQGKHVVIADKNKEKLEQLKQDHDGSRSSNHMLFIETNVSDIESIQRCKEQVLDKWGRIDILVNNAGIRKETALASITVEEWDYILKVNLAGTFFFSQAVIDVMKDQEWGRIINISAYAGQSGPLTSGAHYAASKAGQLALTKAFARELARYNVTVNTIAPAVLNSPESERVESSKMEQIIQSIPVGRLGEMEEVAMIASFLVSEGASYVTGATFDINGGLLMR